MKTKDTTMKRFTASSNHTTRGTSRRGRARVFADKALSIVMSAILVVGLSPLTKVSTATAGEEGEVETSTQGSTIAEGTYGNITFSVNKKKDAFQDDAYKKYRVPNSALGDAGSFHIVAFDTLEAVSECDIYGNVLARNFKNAGDFGFKQAFYENLKGDGNYAEKFPDENLDNLMGLSYIQNYQGNCVRLNKNEKGNGLTVLGSYTNVSSRNGSEILIKVSQENGGQSYVKEMRIEKPNLIMQDEDSDSNPFIDLARVEQETQSKSATLSQRTSSSTEVEQRLIDEGKKRIITYKKGSGCAYVSLTAGQLESSYENIFIDNLPLDGSAAMVINVDCQGKDSVDIPKTYIRVNGNQVGTDEVDQAHNDTGYVLYNFYNTKQNMPITVHECTASVLAPNASITLGSGSACGTFIGNNVTVRSESHARPFHGKFTDTSVSVEKKWLDSKGNAESGDSHDAITAELWYADASGNATTAVKDADGNDVKVQLSADNGWKYTWGDLPTKVNGTTVHYTVKESGMSPNDAASYDSTVSNSGNSFTITNRHKAEVTVSATKVWEDNNNIDGVRPSYVTASIWRQVEGGDWEKLDDKYKLTLNETNEWKATSEPLPATDATGKAYAYKVEEELEGNLVDNYKCSKIEPESSTDEYGNKTYAFKLTNTHESSQINVKVTKKWDDGDDQDGVRPESVEVNLMRSVKGAAQFLQTLTLSADNDWTAEVTELPKWERNDVYTYSVSEVAVDGYTGTVETTQDSSGNYTFELTNTHTPETTSVGVHKVWSDSDNADGLRPDSVQVKLLANGVEVEDRTKTLSEDNGWTANWSGLAKNADGKAIKYAVKEVDVPKGYTPNEPQNSAKDGSFSYKLINTHKAEKTSVSVEKKWANSDGTPDTSDHDAITVQLYKKVGDSEKVAMEGYKLELKASDNPELNWKGSWTNLLANENGEKIEYSIEEVRSPEGYTPSVTKNDTDDGSFSYTLTNTKNKEEGPTTTQVSVKKEWKAADDTPEGGDHAAVKVQLYADGKALGDPVELSAANGWDCTWDKLDKYADDNAIKYEIAEVDGPAGYDAKVGGGLAVDGSFSYTLTNKHKTEKTSVFVHKEWVGDEGSDDLRPATVNVQLYADGKAWSDPVELSAANGWDYTWESLDKNAADGKAINYTIKEIGVPEGYTPNEPQNNAVDGSFSYRLINTYKVEKTSVSVEKQWANSDGTPDASDHDAITVQLYKQVAGGEAEPMDGYTVELSKANNWKGGWSNLPVKQNGETITYSVAEVNVPAGYTSKVTDGEAANSFVITNTADAKTKVSVTKVWEDADNADGLRSDSVTAQLCTVDSQGAAYPVAGKTVELSAGNNWTYTWDDLNLNDVNGKAITYTVQEANVPAGYTFDGPTGGKLADGTFAFTMTNTHERSTTQVSVAKVWNDSDNADGLRPESVTAQLYTVDAQGALTAVEGKTAVLSQENNWAASWTELPAKEAGKAIKYTVREADVPDGYTVDIQGVAADDGTYAFTMTNAHEQEEAELSLAGYSVRSLSASAPEADKVCYVDPKVTKVLTGRTLADGEFAFQLIDDATGNVVSSATNDAKGMVDFDKANNVSGDDMNPCCLQFTAAGTYTYTVRENPSAAKDPTIDYSTEVVTFVTTIVEETAADGTKSLKEKESKYVCYDSAADRAAGVAGKVIAVTGAATEHPTITNSVKAIQLGLTKFNADSTATLEGAVYGLYRAGSVSSDGSSDAVLVAKATSDADGHMTFATTDASEVISEDTEYWFQEISAPEGYKLSLDPTQKFQVKRVGEGDAVKYQLAYADGTVSKEYSIGTVIEFGDAAGVTDEALTIKVNKVDSARQGLSGAKLGVRLADSTDALEEWTSNGAGHVLGGLVAGKQYVLYESEAPNGYAKAADVTFTVDESGTIKLVENAIAKVNDKDVLNAYATDGEASLVNYKSSETVDKKVVQTEKAKTTTTTSKTSTVKTGDSLPVGPIAAVAAVAAACLLIAGAAALASRRRRNK